MSINNDYKNK